jgi:hypothetical protein
MLSSSARASAGSKLKPYLRRPNPTWPEIIDADE